MTDRLEHSPRTLLALHQGAIGDFMLTLSVIESVREGLGVRHVEVIADAASAHLAAALGAIGVCHGTHSVGLHTLFDPDERLHPRLTGLLDAADYAVSFLGDADHDLSRRLTQATETPMAFTDPRPSAGTLKDRRHITSQWHETLCRQDLNIDPPKPISLRPHDSGLGIVIHPGSGGMTKCWPVERFCQLADAINEPVTWMLGPAEMRDNGRFATIRARTSRGPDQLVTPPDLATAAELIGKSRLYLGNDAGITHVAAVLNVPTIAIFGPTDPNVWRPLGAHVHTIAPPRPAPITELTVEQVLDVVRCVVGGI